MVDEHTFVCYARDDAAFVESLTRDLQIRGVAIWMDSDIPAGADWDKTIDERLRRCAQLLIVLSPDAVASNEVRAELRSALNLGKSVIPILHRPCEIPRQLQNIQYLDFTGDHDTTERRDELAHLLLTNRPEVVQPPPPGRALRNRRDLLDDVKHEVATRLAQSLRAATVAVSREARPDQVTRPWDTEVKIVDRRVKPMLADDGLETLVDDQTIAGRLLILGAPGSGKTTTLLELARIFVARGELAASEPMPVLCSLSSWRDDGQPLAEWLIRQLKIKYGVRVDLGRSWLDARGLTPLLDGLDEMPPQLQEPCVGAINRFIDEYRPKHIVVCCRRDEYANYQTKLHLNGAIDLLPLQDEQIQQYLASAGRPDLWRSVFVDPELLALARSPLMLGVMSVATEGGVVPARQPARPSALFDEYIRRLLPEHTTPPRYPNARTVKWLAWLAAMLKEQGHSEFLIERLQPSCLRSTAQRVIYRTLVVVASAAAFAMGLEINDWMSSGIPKGAVFTAYNNKIAEVGFDLNAIVLVIMSLMVGVGLATRPRIRPVESLAWFPPNTWREMKRGMREFALKGATYVNYAAWPVSLVAAIAFIRELWRTESSTNRLSGWDAAGYIAGIVAIGALTIVALIPRRFMTHVAEGQWPRSTVSDSVASGMVFTLGASPAMGPMLAAIPGIGLTMIMAFNQLPVSVSKLTVTKTLAIGVASGLGNGAVTWWIVGNPNLRTWVEVWLIGSVSAAAIMALLLQAVRSSMKAPAVFEHSEFSLSRWLRWLRIGGLTIVVCGLIPLMVGSAGGTQIVRGIGVLLFRFGVACSTGLGVWLVFAAGATFTGLFYGGCAGALLGVLNGLMGPDLQRRTTPNQGVHQSAANIWLFALLGALLLTLPYSVVNLIGAAAEIRVLPTFWDWVRGVGGSAGVFALFGAMIPAAACLQHYALRVVLACSGDAPWRYAPFLNYATDRMLLQRVGGRYRFIHHLLRDHFAEMTPEIAKSDRA